MKLNRRPGRQSRMGSRSRAAVAVAALLALVACDGAGPPTAAVPQEPVAEVVPDAPPVTSPPVTTPPVSAPPVTAPPAAPAPPPPPPPGLHPGMEGEPVRLFQERLVALRYDPGAVDGRYGRGTVLAVMAFQKLAGMPRNGQATPEVLAALDVAADPAPLLPDGGATRVEIDLKRQVLLYWRDGALAKILPVSTGNGKRYCAEGRCGVAVTPSGSYRIERRIRGVRRSHLGVLYDPLYFKGGYAIHGSPSVPAYPASHGCVRIPMHSTRWFFDNVPDRTPVYLVGGKYPAVPFPPDPPPAPPGAEPAPGPEAPPAAEAPAPQPAPAPEPTPAPPGESPPPAAPPSDAPPPGGTGHQPLCWTGTSLDRTLPPVG